MKRMILKSLKLTVITMLITIGMTGCGSKIPELTDEEAELIGEYAAVTLLKYDANHRSRLVDIETVEAYDQKQQEIKEQMAEATPEPEPEGMKPVEDTPVAENGEEVVQEATMTLEESVSVPDGVTVTYLGYETCDIYPQEGATDYYLPVEASAGNKLLVLRFAVENGTTTDVAVDFFSATNAFYIEVSEEKYVENMTTMFLDDMATYAGTLQPGGREELMLLFEVEQSAADTMEDAELYFRKDKNTYKIIL